MKFHFPSDIEGLTHTKILLLVTFCDTTPETEVNFRTQTRTERDEMDEQTDDTVEIVIQIL